jgi:hypothetical protein
MYTMNHMTAATVRAPSRPPSFFYFSEVVSTLSRNEHTTQHTRNMRRAWYVPFKENESRYSKSTSLMELCDEIICRTQFGGENGLEAAFFSVLQWLINIFDLAFFIISIKQDIIHDLGAMVQVES